MGKNSYNGGGTIVHAGSGFFSHKGGPGRRRKPVEGSDRPGPAKPGSICDFGPIRRKKQRVVEFVIKAKKEGFKKTIKSEEKRLRSSAQSLIDRTANLAKQNEREIASLKNALAKAELAKDAIGPVLNFAHSINIHGDQLEDAIKKLDELLRGVSAAPPKTAQRAREKRRIIAKRNRGAL
ncbi:hypothetical protein ACC772_20140 [Rhizobium ruizarguesonis]